MEYSIVYSSNTGNTAMLAEAIKEELGSGECKYFGSVDSKGSDTCKIFIGFWTDKGTCTKDMIDFLKTLRNKEIFIFGTAGFGGSEEYYSNILKNVEENIDSSNKILGTYMCQGKMPIGIRKRYEKMMNESNDYMKFKNLIDNFDRAAFHPNKDDFDELRYRIRESVI